MAQGVVKWFNNKKGFGFIQGLDSGPDIFVHFSEIKGDGFKKLHEGDMVTFDQAQGEMGPKAVNIIKVESAVAEES
ncbi:MAG: cold-shock protein [Sedimentisphaerales bacterium]|nr:cold-shock protein [Sedimentisphaerales bacterium]MBN2843969.1 cold-shock protein [Sedimentisphaerales bacterium]